MLVLPWECLFDLTKMHSRRVCVDWTVNLVCCKHCGCRKWHRDTEGCCGGYLFTVHVYGCIWLVIFLLCPLMTVCSAFHTRFWVRNLFFTPSAKHKLYLRHLTCKAYNIPYSKHNMHERHFILLNGNLSIIHDRAEWGEIFMILIYL